jgi:hypothetical protein
MAIFLKLARDKINFDKFIQRPVAQHVTGSSHSKASSTTPATPAPGQRPA